jgi:DNA-binding IclR family transcriptional regulator
MAVDERLEIIPKTTAEFHFPLHTGSKGQVLLAFSDPSVFQQLVAGPLPPLTDKSIVDPATLYDVLEEIRTNGFAVTREDVQVGTASVAAPIFDRDGELAAAVCVILRVEELGAERVAALAGAVTRTGREVSMRLGWRPGGQPAAIARWAAVDRPAPAVA